MALGVFAPCLGFKLTVGHFPQTGIRSSLMEKGNEKEWGILRCPGSFLLFSPWISKQSAARVCGLGWSQPAEAVEQTLSQTRRSEAMENVSGIEIISTGSNREDKWTSALVPMLMEATWPRVHVSVRPVPATVGKRPASEAPITAQQGRQEGTQHGGSVEDRLQLVPMY